MGRELAGSLLNALHVMFEGLECFPEKKSGMLGGAEFGDNGNGFEGGKSIPDGVGELKEVGEKENGGPLALEELGAEPGTALIGPEKPGQADDGAEDKGGPGGENE